MNLPIVVLAFIIAVLVRISVGSATVAMTMAAGIVAALPELRELVPVISGMYRSGSSGRLHRMLPLCRLVSGW